jgi:hypothetical protein
MISMRFTSDVAPGRDKGTFNDRFVGVSKHNTGGVNPVPGRRRWCENAWRGIHEHSLLFRGELHGSHRVSRPRQACEGSSQHAKMPLPPTTHLHSLPLR